MKLLRILGGLTAAGLGAAAWGYSELTKFELKEYTLPLLPKGTLRGKPEFRLLHLSDLHMIPGQETKIGSALARYARRLYGARMARCQPGSA